MKLLLSFIIVILSYYPVNAELLSNEESEEIITKGEIIATEVIEHLKVWVRHKGKLYICRSAEEALYIRSVCLDSVRKD